MISRSNPDVARATAPTLLVVVYDDRCELCRRCRGWLERSVQLVPVHFVAAADVDAVARLGLTSAVVPVGDELVVVADTGAVWAGPDAFITCLWALADHRRLSGLLQRPALRPLAKRAFHALSAGRSTISSVLGAAAPHNPGCEDGSCQVPSTRCT